jgi:hypothetical protein
MSDSTFWGVFLVACLTIWCVSVVTVSIWAVIAHRVDPWERLADQMRAARDDGWRSS